MNPYVVLENPSDSDLKTIKAAFRKKIKALHPDTRGEVSADRLNEVHKLIEAYELLTDPERQKTFVPPPSPPREEFNYRDWLSQREDDESRAKLIFYDVLRERSPEAVELYARMTKERTFALERLLGREDFMDCAFMLALEYERQGDFVQAVRLFLRIGELEKERPFFRHFFVEVEEHLLNLLTLRITWQLSPADLAATIHEALALPLHSRTQATLYGFLAELYHNHGEGLAARQAWQKAKTLNPKDKFVKKWARVLGVSMLFGVSLIF